MKKYALFVLFAGLVFGLSLSAMAVVEHEVNVEAQGITSLYEEVMTANLFVEENLFNDGSVDFMKDIYIDGGLVSEGKTLEAEGFSSFFEKAVIGGYHNPSGEIVPTGYIVEEVMNAGEIDLEKSLLSVGEWSLLESKSIEAAGATWVDKYVGSWTTDQPWVTTAMADIEFWAGSNYGLENYFNVDMETGDDADNIVPTWPLAIKWANELPGVSSTAKGEIDVFSSELFTDEMLSYEELAIINPGYFGDLRA